VKQILQNLKNGATDVAEVPCPRTKAGHLLIRTRASVVSAGTERMLVEFGKAGYIQKARQQPEKVRMVLDKVKTDGVASTLEAVRAKLDEPLGLGYSNAGVVLEVGQGVEGFQVGDRVVSNGQHAEIVCVPKNLCAAIPAGVADESAAFAVIASVALEGVRLARPTLGECFVVTGLGLVGLCAVQLLRAHGCRVLGLDFDAGKLELARRFGAETVDLSQGQDPLSAAAAFSRTRGVDGVILTAATKSNEPVRQAAQMCRKRGRIILVGVAGLELSRADFYEKELSFQVSCSYGPGRYDAQYEQGGHDYPVGFVRWTEQRNFEAVLDMMASGRIDVDPLISHRFAIHDAPRAYDLLATGDEPTLGIVLNYPRPESESADGQDPRRRTIEIERPSHAAAPVDRPVVAVIGAGGYANLRLLPALAEAPVVLKSIASNGGASATHAARKFGFQSATTDTDSLFDDPRIDAVAIATRHDSHAPLACRALAAGKHLFLEKPLAIDREGLAEVEAAYRAAQSTGSPVVMVDFNRRFAQHTRIAKQLLGTVNEPKSILITVNAGAVPADHWCHDPPAGGGRIVGEGCHFIDLARHLAGAPIGRVQAEAMPSATPSPDRVSFTLRFEDGSLATVLYLANGHKSFPKERVEVFCAGRVLQLDNFRRMRGHGWPHFRKSNLWRQDKGNAAAVAAFVQAVRGGRPSPIPFDEIVEVTEASFQIVEAIS